MIVEFFILVAQNRNVYQSNYVEGVKHFVRRKSTDIILWNWKYDKSPTYRTSKQEYSIYPTLVTHNS